MSNILTAHRQWATRPSDERFQSVDAMLDSVLKRKYVSQEYMATLGQMEIVETIDWDTGDKDIVVDTPIRRARLSNWSFGQLAKAADAPPGYLERLPNDLIIKNLTHGIQQNAEQEVMLYEGTDSLKAITSKNYARIYDADVIQWIKPLVERTTFKLPMQYKDGKWGAELVPGGAYASDRDMFLFMVDDEKRIEVAGESLGRGFFLWNSEVGSKSFGIETFLYRYVCNNNIVWGAQEHRKFRTIHVGQLAGERAAHMLEQNLTSYINTDTSADVEMILRNKKNIVAKNEKEAVEWLVSKDFAKKVSESAVRLAIGEENRCDSVWSLVQGLTAYARSIKHADQRALLERAAGKLLG